MTRSSAAVVRLPGNRLIALAVLLAVVVGLIGMHVLGGNRQSGHAVGSPSALSGPIADGEHRAGYPGAPAGGVMPVSTAADVVTPGTTAMNVAGGGPTATGGSDSMCGSAQECAAMSGPCVPDRPGVPTTVGAGDEAGTTPALHDPGRPVDALTAQPPEVRRPSLHELSISRT
ncbi:hypothetical protein [Tersicoccus phoenicis]|nr:hypothetical protein [Tersicoccus phoenicis]